MPDEEDLRIDQVACATGLTKRAIRYYEEIGLLPEADRTEGNYRRYKPSDVAFLQRLTELKDGLGLPLETLKRFVALDRELGQVRHRYLTQESRDQKLAAVDEAAGLLQEFLQQIDTRMSRLAQERARIQSRLEANAARRAELLDLTKL